MSPVHSYMQSYEGMVKNPKVTVSVNSTAGCVEFFAYHGILPL